MSRLIDADKLKEGVSSYHFKNLIDDQPTVDAEPIRHGYWIKDRLDFFRKCSLCGAFIRRHKDLFDYCPWCGTRMDLVDQEPEE